MITFNDVEESSTGKTGRKKSDVAILGVPFDLATSEHAGQRQAPYAIREAGFWHEGMRHNQTGVDPLEMLDVVDCGDIEVLPGDTIGGWKNIRDRAHAIYPNTRCLLSIGGDHSITAKILAAIAEREKQKLTVIHFDAHTDYSRHDPGVEMNHGTWVRNVIDTGSAERVVQFGVRGWGISAADAQWAERNNVDTCFAQTQTWPSQLRAELDNADGPIYLSVDIDVLDPAFAPGVAYPEPGGLSSRELLSAIYSVASSGKMVGADVVELIPARDPGGITAKAANRCVAQMLTGLASYKVNAVKED